VTVAAWLRYPTEMDAALVAIAGPGGSAVLDWRAGSEPDDASDADADADSGSGSAAGDEGWRTWVDEVVVSWAACLLADPMLAVRAVKAVAVMGFTPLIDDPDSPVAPPRDARPRPRRSDARDGEFRRLLSPDVADVAAAALLRHPDLLEPIAALHRADLHYLLAPDLPAPALTPSG